MAENATWPTGGPIEGITGAGKTNPADVIITALAAARRRRRELGLAGEPLLSITIDEADALARVARITGISQEAQRALAFEQYVEKITDVLPALVVKDVTRQDDGTWTAHLAMPGQPVDTVVIIRH